jgi:hypothetical protein
MGTRRCEPSSYQETKWFGWILFIAGRRRQSARTVETIDVVGLPGARISAQLRTHTVSEGVYPRDVQSERLGRGLCVAFRLGCHESHQVRVEGTGKV